MRFRNLLSVLCSLGIVLTITSAFYKVDFEASPDNYAIVLVISADTNSKAYYAYQEYPILTDDAHSLDIPRHALPHGGYHILAQLMQWRDGEEVAVDYSDSIILVN